MEGIKKFLGRILAAVRNKVAVVLGWLIAFLLVLGGFFLGRKSGRQNGKKEVGNLGYSFEKIEEECDREYERKKKLIIGRPAAAVCQSYGSACDSISEGIERFRKRTESVLSGRSGRNGRSY